MTVGILPTMTATSRGRQQSKQRVVESVRGGGTLAAAARAAGVSVSTVARWKRADPVFDRQIKQALGSRRSGAARSRRTQARSQCAQGIRLHDEAQQGALARTGARNSPTAAARDPVRYLPKCRRSGGSGKRRGSCPRVPVRVSSPNLTTPALKRALSGLVFDGAAGGRSGNLTA